MAQLAQPLVGQAKRWVPAPAGKARSATVHSARTWTNDQGRFAACAAPIGALFLGQRCRKVSKKQARSVLVRSWGVDAPPLPKGTAVKVVGADVVFFHVPGSKGKAYNPQGLEGEVVSVIGDVHLTANRPILVKLTKAPGKEKFKAFNAHFSYDEIEIIGDSVIAEDTTDAQTTSEEDGAVQSVSMTHLKDERWVINLLYDGDCPSCMKQVEFLQKRMDENPQYQGLVAFTNLHDPDYDPDLCGGVVFEDGMRHIHAVTRDGEVIAGMDVFRRIYSIVGMQWVYEITTLPLVGEFFDWLYDWFSEYRLRAAGREDILEKVHNHQAKIQELSATECDVECEVDWDHLDKAPKIAPIVAPSRIN